ncbi:MAG: hypothetical protein IJT05_02565 [Lachnospiraceae bacterium]|nr:hypothetical protein [Lachnospiraceae bacterium]
MRTKKILEELYNTLKDAGAKELTFSEKEETGLPYDVVVMLLDGFGTTTNTAQCEFYFLTKEELGTDMFFCRITLTEEVVPENIPGLCAEIAVLNLELPLGAFSFDVMENALIYQANLPLSPGLSTIEIQEEADGCIASAISVSGRFAGTLVPLAVTWRR